MVLTHYCCHSGFRKTRVFKKPNAQGFLGFGLYFLGRFYLNEQLGSGSLLVGLAHQLSFYLGLSVL